ncbi:GIY-YIG nuclease family protein [archaeon]|nr:MAG: GIY-YIG nuclease family protein [archaeon]
MDKAWASFNKASWSHTPCRALSSLTEETEYIERGILEERGIDLTTSVPTSRAKQLFSTGVPTPFVVVHNWFVPDVKLMERAMHMIFDETRVNSRREFFNAHFNLIPCKSVYVRYVYYNACLIILPHDDIAVIVCPLPT